MGRHHRTLDSRLRALYGWSSKQAVGRNCVGLLKSRLPIPLEEVERELLRTGHWIGEVEQERHDSSRIAVATHWVTLVEKDPRTPRVIETQTDITARLKMQRELEAANLRLKSMTVELERSNEDLEEFARITSHDLAAPLTSSRWLVDLMQLRHADRLDQDGKACLQQISNSLQQMSLLVDSILAHARVGKSAISTAQPTDANQALEIAIESCRKNIELTHAMIRRDVLPAVLIEPHALTQVFQNLLSNALKYRHRDRQPEVHVSARWSGSSCEFRFQDNGIGVDPAWLSGFLSHINVTRGPKPRGAVWAWPPA